MDIDRQRFAGPPVTGAADRRRTEVVECGRDPIMRLGGADSVRGIEGDPAEIRHKGLGPGMPGILLENAVIAMKMPADVAGGNPNAARGGNEDVGEVLADAAP